MNNHSRFIVVLALALVVFLSACGPQPTPVPTVTITPDPCAPDNINAEVQKVHRYMREFDDAANLASSRPRDQLAQSIADLQRIRRDAEDEVIPYCLGTLKTYEISHMNAVINTLMAFMTGADQKVVDQGIAVARQQHDQYLIELARLLGVTVEAATVVPLETASPPPVGTGTPATPTPKK